MFQVGRKEGISERELHDLEWTLESILKELNLSAAHHEDERQERACPAL